MTRLTIGGEIDELVKAAVGLRFMAVIAFQSLAVHRRNVGREMALMVEAEHIGIARIYSLELKFGMPIPE